MFLPTSSSLVALQVVIMTTHSATNDDEIGIMAILGFQYLIVQNCYLGLWKVTYWY